MFLDGSMCLAGQGVGYVVDVWGQPLRYSDLSYWKSFCVYMGMGYPRQCKQAGYWSNLNTRCMCVDVYARWCKRESVCLRAFQRAFRRAKSCRLLSAGHSGSETPLYHRQC